MSNRVECVAAASPEAIWAVVSDVTRVGEWSHECQGADWVDGATSARPGARFRGKNRIGIRAWSRSNEVLTADAPRVLSWRTVPAPFFPDSTVWTITLEPTGAGTRIVQEYEVVKLGPIMSRLYYLTTPKHRDRTAALAEDLRHLGEVAAR